MNNAEPWVLGNTPVRIDPADGSVTELATVDDGLDPEEVSGLVFVGCLLIGLAIGLLTGNTAPWLIGALGVGFIGMAITRYITGEW